MKEVGGGGRYLPVRGSTFHGQTLSPPPGLLSTSTSPTQPGPQLTGPQQLTGHTAPGTPTAADGTSDPRHQLGAQARPQGPEAGTCERHRSQAGTDQARSGPQHGASPGPTSIQPDTSQRALGRAGLPPWPDPGVGSQL